MRGGYCRVSRTGPLVDTTGDKSADTPFLTAIEKAESLRGNPNTPRSQLDAMKRTVERWTNLP